jgi:3-methyladenine DNA glycosylase/8-oxoguanine DNA glycosylase
MVCSFSFPCRPEPLALRVAVSSDGSGGCGIAAHLALPSQRRPRAEVETRGKPSAKRIAPTFAAIARDVLHLDLDLSPFYERMRDETGYAWIAENRTGRLLRGQTFFEDVVKMILTTNCSWSLTKSMNERLIAHFGAEGIDGSRCFPRAGGHRRQQRNLPPHGSAPRLPRAFRTGTRARVSPRVRSRRRVLPYRERPAAELHKALRGIKGVGEYAASSLLKLLGRFEYLGLDSWCRSKFAELHNGGSAVADKDIETHYERFEEWKGLVMWLDVTRQWYSLKFPF